MIMHISTATRELLWICRCKGMWVCKWFLGIWKILIVPHTRVHTQEGRPSVHCKTPN